MWYSSKRDIGFYSERTHSSNKLFSRNILISSQNVKKSSKTRSPFLRKKQHHYSVKSRQISVTFLLKKLLKSWFHGNFWASSRFIVLFHTKRNKEVTELISRINFGESKLLVFPHCSLRVVLVYRYLQWFKSGSRKKLYQKSSTKRAIMQTISGEKAENH